MDKVNFSEFVKQVSKKSTYAQKDIKAILNASSDVIIDNLNDGRATTIMTGVIIYPATFSGFDRVENGETIHYNEVVYPRARFGLSFKKQMLF